MLKTSVLTFLLLVCGLIAFSQSQSIVQHIASQGSISVTQPESLAGLLVAPNHVAVETTVDQSDVVDNYSTSTRAGYRVQVFDDNNPRSARSQAEACHSQLKAHFPHIRSYITFNSPYWRVKVGDYRTRAEAEAAMAELRHAFPARAAYMRIVRDKINVTD